jgi:pilus assembly protein CpaE
LNHNPRILVIGPDRRLFTECEQAAARITNLQPVLHHVADYTTAAQALRNRHPEFAIVEMGKDLGPLKALADEAATASPDTVLVAAFLPNVFAADVSESAILIEAMRAGMRDFLRRPLSRTDLEQLLVRQNGKAKIAPANIGKVLSFISNKGGVGKSTIAVNCACGLARQRPGRVLLVDGSLQLGVCANLLDLQPTTTLTDAIRQRDRLDETLLRELTVQHESGLHLLAAPANAVEAAEVTDEAMSRVLTLARRAYDIVIVDSFPLLDCVMMAVLDLSDRVYIVLESVVPTLLGGVKLLHLLEGLGVKPEKQRVILNRYSRFAGNLTPADVEDRLGRKVNYLIPYQKKLLIAGNLGDPLIRTASTWYGWGLAMHRMIGEMKRETEQ